MRRNVLLSALIGAVLMLAIAGCGTGAQPSGDASNGTSTSADASSQAAQSEESFDADSDEVLNAVVDRGKVLHSEHLG